MVIVDGDIGQGELLDNPAAAFFAGVMRDDGFGVEGDSLDEVPFARAGAASGTFRLNHRRSLQNILE